MKKVSKKLSKKATEQLKRGIEVIPPKGVLLELLTDACRLLSGISCGALTKDDPATSFEVYKVLTITQEIMKEVRESDLAQAELETEEQVAFHKIVSQLDEDVLDEILSGFREEEGDESGDRIERAARIIKSGEIFNKD